MNILEKIIIQKREELVVRKMLVPLEEIMQSVQMKRKSISLAKSVTGRSTPFIIAEFKRKSPSKGFINQQADVTKITPAYVEAGASALSILTDRQFFGGSTKDIFQARKNEIPILRKDFIIDEYQVYASKVMGADIILLIAACLTPKEVKDLASCAHLLGMEVLLEIHEESELDYICSEIDFAGINNRNLKTFETDIDNSIRLAEKLPREIIKISESGIDNTAVVKKLFAAGFQGFLIGEQFMKQPDPGLALKIFLEELN
ncbi:MAG: indole-3-glycerol phosphate synthase TrpC [Ferruginibacter sp.]